MFEKQGLNVQAQDKYPQRIAVDQAGGQTINHDAKTVGGIKSFTTKSENVMKWSLNGAEKAKNKRTLEDLCGLGNGECTYKPAWPSQVMKPEKLVKLVMDVFNGRLHQPLSS